MTDTKPDPHGYTPDGEHGREWLRGLLSDLADDGLVRIEKGDDRITARLQ